MLPKFLNPIFSNKNNETMTKLLLLTSHMSFMTNGWYLSHHCATSCLNDYCPK